MMKDSLIHFTDSHLTVIGFLLFVVVFVGYLIWTLFIEKTEYYQDLSQLPLVDGEQNGK